MNPKFRLAEIEVQLKIAREAGVANEDIDWLVSRVRQLEKALEKIIDKTKDYKSNSHITLASNPPQNGCTYYVNVIASKALNGEGE